MQIILNGFQLRMFLLGLFDKGDLFGSLFDGPFQIFQVDRFRCEVECSLVHGASDIFHIAVGRYHNTFECRVAHLVDFGEQGQTVHFRHIDIAQDHIEVWFGKQHLECFQSVVGK